MTGERDYSGVPTSELAVVYRSFVRATRIDFESFASRIPMSIRDLKKILVTQDYAFVGLGIADNILFLGMDKNISEMSMAGEIHVVPARDSRNSARKMVMDRLDAVVYDKLWVPGREVTQDEIDAVILRLPQDRIEVEIDRLLADRRRYVRPTPAQRARLQADSQRKTKIAT